MTQHRSSSLSTAAKALPPIVAALMQPFREFFTAPVWRRLLILIAGMVLSPGKRTVSAALRVMGLGATKDFARYHYVLKVKSIALMHGLTHNMVCGWRLIAI